MCYRRRWWHSTPVLSPGKSHGQRSLVGCSPWGHEESDMAERLPFHFSLSCMGEGNGNPLQCSCQENPRNRGAWWAAVYGIAQSQTRLKWVSSSSYIENPKDSTRKLLELINEYSKVAGYKINTQKSLAFLYTTNEKIEIEIKETIPFTTAPKRIKYLGIYLPK